MIKLKFLLLLRNNILLRDLDFYIFVCQHYDTYKFTSTDVNCFVVFLLTKQKAHKNILQ